MRQTLLLILTLACINGYSQQTLSGKVIDTSENRALHNAVVSIIKPVDSILIQFTRTKDDGSFALKNLPNQFIILITYPGYADYFEVIRDSTKKEITLGTVPLTQKGQLLEAVIVKQQIAAIRMKGDTLEYKADSFKVSQGSTVDELLKKLPGIQVDRNGQITVQGQTVKKVLVDGEEFFSDDPAVVIKNLQAEAVKEVQVFDKKSDQAEFTGIDDGERSKTINLTLKPEKKKGYFVKGALNGGTSGSFDNNAMFNSFKGSKKVAAYGIMSNTGRQGLGWQDSEKFGGSDNVEYNEDDQMYYYMGDGDDEFSQESNGQDGLPAAWTAGFHFSDKWRSDKEKINANYRFLKKNLFAEGTLRSQYILPDTQYFNNQSRESFNSKIGHKLKGVYELKFDSLSTVKITVGGDVTRNENASRQESYALNADSGMVNRNERTLSGITDQNNFNATVLWKKRFRKVGRTLSINLDEQSRNQDLDGLLQSKTEFYNALGQVNNEELIDQKKNNKQNSLSVKGTAVYTEPLSKSLFLSVNYGLRFSNVEAFRNSFNKGQNNEYLDRDSLFSNDFRFQYNMHSTGADIKYNKKKLMMILGSGVNFSNFKQTDLLKDSARSYSYVNYLPKFTFRYSPKSTRSLMIRYNGSNDPPNLEQLQPLRQNSDPLNVQIGNPGLRQSFNHAFNFFLYDFKVISERNFQVSGYSNFTQNAISNSTVVDEGGKTIIQPINVNGNYSINLFGGMGGKFKKSSIYFNVFGQYSNIHNKNRVNNLDNINDYKTYSLNLRVQKSKNEKYSFVIRPGLGYTFSKSTLRPDVVTKYLTSESGVEAWIKLPWKLEFYSETNFNLRQKTDVFDVNRNVIKWDANITKKFMKNNNLELRLAVYDLLNQNIGFSRMAQTNVITENNFLTLRRMFMIGLQYNISKNP